MTDEGWCNGKIPHPTRLRRATFSGKREKDAPASSLFLIECESHRCVF
jgi:hypothetical protein